MKCHECAGFPVLRSQRCAALTAVLFCTAFVLSTGAAAQPEQTARAQARLIDFAAIQRAVQDLSASYPHMQSDLETQWLQIKAYQATWPAVLTGLKNSDPASLARATDLVRLKRDLLLANPLLDFDRLLIVKRGAKKLGLPTNWQGNSDIPSKGYDNEIAVLSNLRAHGRLTPFFRPEGGEYVGDIDLDFDAKRLLFSIPGKHGRWGIFQINTDGTALAPLPLIHEPDVDNYDACYLPSGDIIFNSTAPFVGVPCVTGSSHVTNLYLLKRPEDSIRRLTFEQDHDWCPTVLNNGRVLYLRWEYSDIPHYVSRILFHMNPDGTEQMEFYGSNSYWPNSMFFARPVPNSPTQFVAVIGGHHDVPRMGELILFDVAKGRQEADGVIQRIPGHGKRVTPKILDGLVKDSWPKFLHPYPLSDKYIITACQPTAQSNWGIYLVDVFDNLTLIKDIPGYALLEPIPFRETQRPPRVADKVDTSRKDAVVYLMDVYAGPGLRGVPRGTVKTLRLFTYHFAYHGMGGQTNRIGYDGPWDIKRIMGTVPVEADGSAMFRVPANTPIAVQPLDADGKAIQLMRSWFTAMPGEVLSCVGCHEQQNSTPKPASTLASRKAPADITPWYGPVRGFSFVREVQPVLDAHCVQCHDGSEEALAKHMPDFRPAPPVVSKYGGRFTPAYRHLYSFVRSHTMESDIHLLNPYEFHADSTRLVQMLQAGHHRVALNAQAWDRLITWIDLNTPAHGTWTEIVGQDKVNHQDDRRRQMMARYAGIHDRPEETLAPVVLRTPDPPSGGVAQASETPQRRMASEPIPADVGKRRTLDIGQGIKLHLVRTGLTTWMGETEVTNEQFAQFDPSHDSRLEHGEFLQFSVQERGYLVNGAKQPVVRVSWDRAMAFCDWLSRTTGLSFTLPTEDQWESACRAGTQTPMWFGDLTTDFAPYANLADAAFKKVDTFSPWALPSGAIEELRPAMSTVNDAHRVSAPVASFKPNPWGLYDMHGNAAEWTQSPSTQGAQRRVVRGGSWYDRPKTAHSAFKLSYHKWMGVYDVGFRVVCQDAAMVAEHASYGAKDLD